MIRRSTAYAPLVLLLALVLVAAPLFGLAHASGPGQSFDPTVTPPALDPTPDYGAVTGADDPGSDPGESGAPTGADGPLPTTNSVLSLPLSATFDSATGWRASGAWRFDPALGYDGGGWLLDGTLAETVSTLEYDALVDLSGALDAQIMFRYRGRLPTTDLVAVDVSVDGGTTWLPVDLRVGLESDLERGAPTVVSDDPTTEAGRPPVTGLDTALVDTVAAQESIPAPEDWERFTVDLAPYRNQIVRLRLRVETGTRPGADAGADPEAGGSGGDDSFFLQIDNLTINHLLEVEIEIEPLFAGPHTLLGLHMVVGAREGPVLELVQRLRSAGIPLGTLKGTSTNEKLLNMVAEISPETIIVYRSLETPRGMIDCPYSWEDPVQEARDWMNGLWGYWAQVNADYYEIMNECGPPLEWLAPFTIEAMRLATERGYCILAFSFAAGFPEPYQYGALLPVYEYALQNPCQPGRYHGIALHTYSGDPYQLVSESGIWLGYRYRLYYEQILPSLPDAVKLPVFLTETGPGNGRVEFACDEVARDMLQYTWQIDQNDPFIAGLHLWNFGLPTLDWVDLTHCLPLLGDALLRYYGR